MSQPAILAVASLPPPLAGQSLATAALVTALDERGIAHQVVDLSREFVTERPLRARWRRALDVARLPLEVTRAARKLEGDVVFYLQLGQSTAALARDLPLLALARARRWPIVVHVHGGTFRQAFDRAPAPLRLAIGRLLSSVARAVALSPSLAPMFDGIVPADRVVCVANGTVAEVSARARTLDRAPPSGGLTAVFLSNLIDSKGYATVLEAARLSLERGLDHRFVLAGAMTEYSSVDPAAVIDRDGLSNAEYLGVVSGPDKLELLASAGVLVLPIANPTEGQPIAILEAMQLGLPVITTSCGGIADVVSAPECGELVEPGDPAAIVEALERLRDRQRWRKVSEHNRSVGLELYTHQRHGAAMIAVFEDALREGG